ncbi:MAG TPA: hypothetical protein VFO66_04260 [Gemmatimonadaceae bacterium]|nr:hypothetical protein [Gemmatimonadaceae bacterium]
MRIRILSLALLLTACQDLTVTNPNRPDARRATSQPGATEAFIASSFRKWWPVAGHDDYPSWAFSTMAWEVTSGFADFGQLELSAEPRSAWNNSPVNARNNVSEEPWYELYGANSAVTDAIVAINDGLIITDTATTLRDKAFAKFMQGVSHGYLGLYFDSAFVVDERLDLDTITVPRLQPYPAVITAAIAMLDSAIVIANSTTNFTLPSSNFFFTTMTRDQFVRLANSFVARLMVYSARTRAERAAVDWPGVITRVNAGITTDFAPIGQPDILWDDWKRLVARVRQASRPSDFGRPSYWLLGPADSAQGWVNWVATPVANRVAFQIRTKDRRIQGTGGPATPGIYVGYNNNNIFAASRGTYRFSHYYFHRYGTLDTWQSGPLPAMLVSEMNLLKAEAYIRTGQAALAVPLINLTRTANGQLPAVTIDGPPVAAGCVPRQRDGDCGTLWDALRYEKNIEGLGVSGVIAFFDARGWQTLPENTILQLPVPGRELAILRRDLYTYGGPGGTFSAPAPDHERCPSGYTSLRCP